MVTTGLPAPGFAATDGQVMRVRSRTESMSSETALRSGPGEGGGRDDGGMREVGGDGRRDG